MKYTLAYQHNNGAYVYESEQGNKVYNYNNQWFKTINDVNKYIQESGILLKRTDHNHIPRIEKENPVDYNLSIEDYKNIRFK